MVITRSLETACTGQFSTIFYFAFFGTELERAEPELAELGFGTELAEPGNWPDEEPNGIDPNQNFLTPHILETRFELTSTLISEKIT